MLLGFCLDFSALKTSKINGLTYRDVLGFYHFVRYLMFKESMFDDSFAGIVEVDESYFGGINRKRNKKYRKPVGRGRGTDKTVVFGIKERNDGRVWIDLPKALDSQTLVGLIESKVEKGSKVMSDEFSSYSGLIIKGYVHRLVEHGRDEYARGSVHINGMENFWSWAKEKMIKFHGVYDRRFILYLKELEWKFNRRNLSIEEQIEKIIELLPTRFNKYLVQNSA